MNFTLTEKAIEWFENANISFHNRFGARLYPGHQIDFRDNVQVEPFVGIHGGSTIAEMGFMSYTNSPLPENIRVGRYCSIGPYVQFPAYNHPIGHLSTSIFTHDRRTDLVQRVVRHGDPTYDNFFPNPQKDGIVIGHDVWIGQYAAIMAGVTIGTGAVIAANSVVTRSVMPYEIVGGNPAKPIRSRFDNELTNRLLLSEWWRYKFTDFVGLDISDPREFLKGFDRRKSTLAEYRPTLVRIADVLNLGD